MKNKGNFVVANLQEQASYLTDTGVADAYVVTFPDPISSYTSGLLVRFKATNANTGASTINVDGLGPQSIKKAVSSSLSSDDILSDQIIILIYDGTNFQLMNSTTVGSFWSRAGNSGTTPGTDFLGTTDNVGLMFKVNNIQSGYIDIDNVSTSFGYFSLSANSAGGGSGNTGFGYQALKNNGIGAHNVAVGYNSLFTNVLGNFNTAVGFSALVSNNGSINTAIGHETLSNNTTGSKNTGLGYNAGKYNTTVSNQIFINGLDRGDYNGDKTLSPIYIVQDPAVTSQTITLNGSVGINTTTPSLCAALDVPSTTRGLLLPRMTKTQRDAITSPVAGLAVYQTDNTPGLRVYNGTNWIRYTETID